MSDDEPVFVQLVELLGVAEAVANEQPVIVITIRPDPSTFRPHNIALTKDQAWRLATDLGSILLPFVLLVSITMTIGCGAKVDLESANWDSSSGERSATSVEVDVLRPQRPKAVAETKVIEPPPKPTAEAKPLNISGNTIILSIRGGDTYCHSETHVHLDAQPPVPKVEERIVIQREFRAEPPRRVSEQCERLARQHEERVRKWRESPGGS
ncbi:MAG: hypothetical protein ACYC4N_12650 [Pirellulaceae bacterium]